eukprot:XP_028344225.1 uncharacterized protein C1orf21 homolog isoform X1 [Physeter catodon]
MVGGDLCGSPIIPNAPCRLGLGPLVPRGRRGKEGAQGAKSQAVSPSPPQCSFCPVADASFILQAPRLQGRVAGQGPGPLGNARRSSEGRGREARRGCPAFRPSASSRRSPAAGPKGWLGFPAELGRPGPRAAPRLPRHRPGVRPRTQLSRRGLPSLWPAGAGCAPASVRAHTHTPVLTLLPSLQPWQPRSPGPFLRGARHPRGLRRPFPGARLRPGRAQEPGAGRGRRCGSVWLPPPLECAHFDRLSKKVDFPCV